MSRFLIIISLVLGSISANAQNSLPGTYLFDVPPTAIFAQMIYNDTIVCMGVMFKEGDTITYQQGLFVAFIDSCGNVIRIRKYFDSQGRDIFLNLTNQIIRTHDGGFCFVGLVGSNNVFVKTNGSGDVTIAKDFSPILGFDDCSLFSVHEIQNSFYSIGYGDNFTPYRDDIFLAKFDQNGNLLFSKRFETPENCEYSGEAISRGNNIVIPTVRTNACIEGGLLKAKTRIFEIDTTGTILWDWVDENSNLRRGGGAGLTNTADGGWVYGGSYVDTFYFGFQYYRPFVTKIDSNFNHEWTRVFGYPDNKYNGIRDIVIDADGNYIAAGQYTTGFPDFPNAFPAVAAYIAKITPDGEVLWTNYAKAFQDGPNNVQTMFTYNINLLSSGNIIIGGHLYRIVDLIPQSEGWLAKLSPDGEVLDEPDPFCGVVSVKESLTGKNGIIGYPNPVADYFNIILPEDLFCHTLRINDQMGRIVFEKVFEDQTGSLIVETKGFVDGIYFYQLTCSKNQSFSGKFVVRK